MIETWNKSQTRSVNRTFNDSPNEQEGNSPPNIPERGRSG